MTLIQYLISDDCLSRAYHWLCQRREKHHPNSDVWHLRWQWPQLKEKMIDAVLAGKYQFQPLREIRLPDGIRYVWAASDALLLKALSLALKNRLDLPECGHLEGTGLKKTLRTVQNKINDYTFFIRTDVKGYYANIQKETLYKLVSQKIKDPLILRLVHQYLYYTTEYGGNFQASEKGISLGCPLSPLMGALYLKSLDEAMTQQGVFYQRYMDDWVIFTNKRWTLKNAIKKMNQILTSLGLEKHPDKTEIGRISKGFDFLGHHFGTQEKGFILAKTTLDRCFAKMHQLYEQQRNDTVLDAYWQRWLSWVTGGLDDDNLNLGAWMDQVEYWLKSQVTDLCGESCGKRLWRACVRHVSSFLSSRALHARPRGISI